MNIDQMVRFILLLSLIVGVLCSFYIAVRYFISATKPKSASKMDLFLNTWQFPMLLSILLDEIIYRINL